MDEIDLECLCDGIQRIINRYGYSDSLICGGYVANGSVLLSLASSLFINAIMLKEIRDFYNCDAIATNGAIMLHKPEIRKCSINTMDMLELIALHQCGALGHDTDGRNRWQ